MLPLLGPRTLRDAIANTPESGRGSLFHYENSSVRDKLWGLEAIHLRTKLLASESAIESSNDAYLTVREAYLQNRKYLINDGNAPDGDNDLFEDLETEE